MLRTLATPVKFKCLKALNILMLKSFLRLKSLLEFFHLIIHKVKNLIKDIPIMTLKYKNYYSFFNKVRV